jgi:hypothetical protein
MKCADREDSAVGWKSSGEDAWPMREAHDWKV